MKCVIIDDEVNAIKSLRWDIEHFTEDVEVIADFSRPREAIEYLKEHQEVDLVFLDIKMPEMNGFELLDELGSFNFYVIFVTAHRNFSLDAIKIEAVDYLLKPIDDSDLTQAIEKVKKRIKTTETHQQMSDIYSVLKKTKENQPFKIKLISDKKMLFLSPEDIIYCESDGNYCTVYLEDEPPLLLSQKLKEVSAQLPEDIFYRIHKSFTVNLNKVTSYLISDNIVILNHDTRIPVSRMKKDDFITKISDN